ncbi:MAG: GspE/PulE family protein [Pirellulaceae bacterium]
MSEYLTPEVIAVSVAIIWLILSGLIVRFFRKCRAIPRRWPWLQNTLLLLLGPLYLMLFVCIDVVLQMRREKVPFRQALRRSFRPPEIKRAPEPVDEFPFELLDKNGVPLAEVNAKIAESEIIKLTREILRQAVIMASSDVLIQPVDDVTSNVRFRINGRLRSIRDLTPDESRAIINSIKAISGMDISDRRRPQDGVFAARVKYGVISFRVATVGVLNGEKVSVRILDQHASQFTLDSIGLTGFELQAVKKTLLHDAGMILVCGPTGSGKSSTVHAMLQAIDRIERNVITIEDPIEYILPDASQIEVNPRAGLTFEKALRSILRQDPDVISIGEIRDGETAEIAIQAAQTGHLVFATVHSDSNQQALLRLNDLGVRPMLLGSALSLILSQRLVRRLCEACKKPAKFDAKERDNLWKQHVDPDSLFQAGGCSLCHQTGYTGRMAVFDLAIMDAQRRETLTRGDMVLNQVHTETTPMLQMQATRLALTGMTSWPEVERLAATVE